LTLPHQIYSELWISNTTENEEGSKLGTIKKKKTQTTKPSTRCWQIYKQDSSQAAATQKYWGTSASPSSSSHLFPYIHSLLPGTSFSLYYHPPKIPNQT